MLHLLTFSRGNLSQLHLYLISLSKINRLITLQIGAKQCEEEREEGEVRELDGEEKERWPRKEGTLPHSESHLCPDKLTSR